MEKIQQAKRCALSYWMKYACKNEIEYFARKVCFSGMTDLDEQLQFVIDLSPELILDDEFQQFQSYMSVVIEPISNTELIQENS